MSCLPPTASRRGLHSTAASRLEPSREGHSQRIWNTVAWTRAFALQHVRITSSGARDFVEHFPVGAEQLDAKRHLSECVGGATQAGVVAADHGLDAVEHARRQAVAV